MKAELRRQELLEEADRYLADLTDEVGTPLRADVAKAKKLAPSIKNKPESPTADQ
ncbi:hypothetical protein [Candidatus Poriferisocius sp.]|uniref:hypothetical protein n=1 Tax=Candidatus Poriferisocius sp. TaxID=3101276 RepID=UPI003B5A375D